MKKMSRMQFGMVVVLVVLLAGGCAMCKKMFGEGNELTLAQTPAAVRATIEKESQGAKIKEIEKENEDGKVQYSVELDKDGAKSELAIGEDGKVLEREVKLKLEQAPAAVQAALKKEAEGGKLGKEIEKGEKDGKPVYSADVKVGKKKSEVTVGEDGKVLSREEAGKEKD